MLIALINTVTIEFLVVVLSFGKTSKYVPYCNLYCDSTFIFSQEEEEAEAQFTGPHGVGISSWCLGLRLGERRSESGNSRSDNWPLNRGLQ